MPAIATRLRPYHDFRDYGRIGGLQTALRHGSDYMAVIGRRGGLARRLPTLSELRQQSVHEVQYHLKGGNRLPNRLSELKGLWKLQNKNGGLGSVAAPCPPGKEWY
ncbi:hypothetical protein ES703_35150 [subsurface metagenome]